MENDKMRSFNMTGQFDNVIIIDNVSTQAAASSVAQARTFG